MSSFLSKKNMSLYSQISIKLHGCCCIAASLIFFLYGRVMQLQKKQTSVSAEKVPNQKKKTILFVGFKSKVKHPPDTAGTNENDVTRPPNDATLH